MLDKTLEEVTGRWKADLLCYWLYHLSGSYNTVKPVLFTFWTLNSEDCIKSVDASLPFLNCRNHSECFSPTMIEQLISKRLL